MYLRRACRVLNNESSRRYYPVKAYLDKLREAHPCVKNIVLFTDIKNAVNPANDLHPGFNWMFMEKKRCRGSERGWENQIPSDDAVDEFVSVMSICKLTIKCNIFVCAHNLLADSIMSRMEAKSRPIHPTRIDENEVFSITCTKSEEDFRNINIS